jgi:2-polyprenyl-6-methoxyphenol hydroxylase-like FAD-dependent oxidoreductase
MTAVRRVLIVGGGIGGLSTAIALRRTGIHVDIVEINPKWSVYGVGIIQPANALRALDVLGVAHRCVEEGFPFEGTRVYDADGTVLLADSQFPRVVPDLPAMNGITRPRFHRILSETTLDAGANVRLGVTVASLTQRGSEVDVGLSDGTSATYDLVVGADGIHSHIRKLVFPGAPAPAYAGQIVWRCNVPRSPSVDAICMYLREGGSTGKAGLVPIGRDLAYMFMGEVWPLEKLSALRTGLADTMRRQLAGHGGMIGELCDRHVTDSNEIVVRPLESILVPPPWHRGRVVLIGDAAHAPTSKLGQGAAQAIEDGIVLDQELRDKDTVEDALHAFMERRYERCKFVVDASLQVGRWEMGLDQETIDHAGMAVRSMEVTAQPI